MERPPHSTPLVVAGLLATLACANPFAEPPSAPEPSLPSAPVEPPAERPPPGGWIADGVIYAADGSVYGCVGGGNACAGPTAGQTAEEEADLDLCGAVDAIRDAELDHRDRTGRYLAVPPTPRAPSAVDLSAVAVPARTPFAELGWAPPSPTRASFWVDVTDDGFEAHGLALTGPDRWLHCFATADRGAVDTPWRPR